MKPKIAVIGDGTGKDQKVKAIAWEIGREIANINAILYTGGCNGYPHAAAEGAIHVGGKAIAISPAKDIFEHINYYKFPTQEKIEIRCTGLGIPGRNTALINEADAVIVIGGKIGTLNEFTLAFISRKIIGVVMKTGGIIDLLPHIIIACDRGDDKERMVFFEEPINVVKHVIILLNKYRKA